jgi:cytochrome c553
LKRLLAAFATILALACMVSSARAENQFDYCLLCHGANANGNYGIRAPKLSGMEPWYLARQLENFAAGVRGSPGADAAGHEMRPVAWRLKQEDRLEAAVKFICHGARGEGNAALQSPALAARSDWYLVTQLANYKAGLRGADERDTYGAQMRAIAATLPDDKAIADVVAYINTLR